VVVLDEPIAMGTYGETPELDYVSDQYGSQPRNEYRFEVVGYCLEKSGPFVAEGDDTCRKGDVKLDSLNSVPPDTYILLSISNGKVHRGGTCFGDSSGPTFDDTDSNLVIAVTSFGSARPALASAAFIASTNPTTSPSWRHRDHALI
jgi:hypothetical protein